MAKSNGKERAVLVTTAHRGVFFGYIDPKKIRDDVIRLTRARLCLYWSRDVRGFMGLAVTGPTATCRIGPSAPAIDVRKVTAVLDVTPAAVESWPSRMKI